MSEKYYLPQQIEHYLRVLALRYEALENKLSREIIVNAKYKIEEGVGWDNWNGGCSGHDIVLIIPDTLYSKVLENKKDIESKIYNDLREISNCENEYWQSIYIDIESRDDNWRSRHEDVLIAKRKTVTNHSMKRIWGSGIVRLFLSHKVECKKQVEQLKETLKKYGISSFVAHTSIRPTKEWLNEIENALLTMDAFAAFLTDNFRDSEWTDQEVGFALSSGVPIIPISLTDQDPHGFMGKYQKMTASFDDISEMACKIFSTLMEEVDMKEKLTDCAIEAFVKSSSFHESKNFVDNILPHINFLSPNQLEKIIKGYAENNQIHTGYKSVQRDIPNQLYRITEKEFKIENNQLVEVVKDVAWDA